MVQATGVDVGSEDYARSTALIGDRNRPPKHVQRAALSCFRQRLREAAHHDHLPKNMQIHGHMLIELSDGSRSSCGSGTGSGEALSGGPLVD